MALVSEWPVLNKPAIYRQDGESHMLPCSRNLIAEFERPEMLQLRPSQEDQEGLLLAEVRPSISSGYRLSTTLSGHSSNSRNTSQWVTARTKYP
jgi:hypothetical protein